MTTPQQQQLEGLIAEAMERFDEHGDAGVDAVCGAHPEHAAAIRAALERCEAAGLLRRESGGLPPKLGRFRPVRRLGTGGMGVVYLAETDAGDEVALKLIRPDLVWFDGARERFRREVEAIASIDHPGVVPVLEVGEQDGVPWFAMERVDGRSLADVVAERRGGATDPDWPAAAARVIEQVAEAMHHVHLRGIVHRDLKPSNVMLRPDGRAQVLDFGLAHVSGNASLTRTGATIGSLAYMSPEQLRGEAVDARTDVYSLGATLYELLTLVPPFAGRDEVELRAKILDGAPARPRAVAPAVPAALETLCRVAMDRDRGRRPESMAELAADLSRFGAGRPIRARLPGRSVRAARWLRRHPAAGAALGVAALFLLLLPVVLLLQERAANRVIQQERGKAQSNYDDALSAVSRLLLQMADDELRSNAGLAPLRERMFRDAIEVLTDLERTTADPRARHLRARALGLLGDVLGAQDQHAESRRALEEALSIWAEQREAAADAVQLWVADARQKLAIALHRLGEPEAAMRCSERSIADVDRSDWPEDLRDAALQVLSQSHNARSVLLEHADRLADAAEARNRALAIKRTLVDRDDGPGSRQGLADQLLKSARLAPFEASRAMLEEAITLAEALPDPLPRSPARAELLSRAHRRLGILLAERGQVDAADHLVAAAAASAEFLYQNPRLPRAYSEQAEDLNNLSILRYGQHRIEDALAAAEKAVALQKRALELAPGTPRFLHFLGNHLFNQIQALTQLDRPAELAAAATELGRLEPDAYTTLAAAFALLLAARADSADAAARRQWTQEAGRLVARAEAMGQGYDPMLGNDLFELLRDDREAAASLDRMRAKK